MSSLTEPSDQPGDEIRAGDTVAHRHRPVRVGHVDEVLKGGASFFLPDVDSHIDFVAWVKREGENKRVAEPIADLIKWT